MKAIPHSNPQINHQGRRALLHAFWVLGAVALVVVSCAICWGANLDFEQPQSGWTTLAPTVEWQDSQASQGERCLALENPAQAEAWTVSGVIEEFAGGEPVELSLALRRLSGEGEIALALVPDAGKPQSPALWRGVPEANAGWHRLALKVVTGLSAPRLAIGALGAPSRWLVDDIRVRPVRLKPVTRRVKPADLPEYSATIEDGWQPDGKMDLQTREIMGIESTFIRPGALDLNPEQEITVSRGERYGTFLDALSRGAASKVLTIETMGPAGWLTEKMSREIEGRGKVSLNIPVQALLVGDFRLKIAFHVDDDTKYMPLLVHSQRYAPAFGVSWDPASIAGADLTPFREMPAQFHAVALDSPALLPAVKRLTQTGADVALTWRAPAADGLAGLAGVSPDMVPLAGAFSLHAPDETLQQAEEFYKAARAVTGQAVVHSIPFDLTAGPTGLSAGKALDDSLASGVARWADALTVRHPRFSGSAVVGESVDGRSPDGPMQAWDWFDRAWDMGALRGLLRGQDAQLPFYSEAMGGRTTGDPGLDALLLARSILHVVSMGAQGVSVPAVAEDASQIAFLGPDGKPNETLFTVYRELTRELAGVRALTPPAETEFAGYAPGKPVTFRPFIRADEGIIALWNNTQTPQKIAVDVRCEPMQMRLLRISYPGETVQREFSGQFEWSAMARAWGHPAVYVEVAPLQVAILSLKLRGAHNQWLREVGEQPPSPKGKDPMDREEFHKRLWGER